MKCPNCGKKQDEIDEACGMCTLCGYKTMEEVKQ